MVADDQFAGALFQLNGHPKRTYDRADLPSFSHHFRLRPQGIIVTGPTIGENIQANYLLVLILGSSILLVLALRLLNRWTRARPMFRLLK